MYHIAQVNIAMLLAPEGDPKVADYYANIDRINALAENSVGFIWRRVDDYGDNPSQLFNLSVWQDIESLSDFVYRSDHMKMLRRKTEWTLPMTKAHSALWWVPQGHTPSAGEAMTKISHLNMFGPSATAFTFSHPYPAPKN